MKIYIDLAGTICFLAGCAALGFGRPEYATPFFVLRIIASIDLRELREKGMV